MYKWHTCCRIFGWPMTYDWNRLDSGFASVLTNSVPTLNTSAAIAAESGAAALLPSAVGASLRRHAVVQSGGLLPNPVRCWPAKRVLLPARRLQNPSRLLPAAASLARKLVARQQLTPRHRCR